VRLGLIMSWPSPCVAAVLAGGYSDGAGRPCGAVLD
jgi:hypothetical protein